VTVNRSNIPLRTSTGPARSLRTPRRPVAREEQGSNFKPGIIHRPDSVHTLHGPPHPDSVAAYISREITERLSEVTGKWDAVAEKLDDLLDSGE
jgi:hypothetical protein